MKINERYLFALAVSLLAGCSDVAMCKSVSTSVQSRLHSYYETNAADLSRQSRIDLYENRLNFGEAGSLSIRPSEFGRTFQIITSSDAILATDVPLIAPKRAFASIRNGRFTCSAVQNGDSFHVTCVSSGGSTYRSVYVKRIGIVSFDYFCHHYGDDICRYSIISRNAFLSDLMIRELNL
jgi:hypothetical protein